MLTLSKGKIMSTRMNVLIKDDYRKLWFYRHSDGYPEGAMPTLQAFINLVRSGKIRDNVSQSAGWLVVLGCIEYQTIPSGLFEQSKKKSWDRDDKAVDKSIANLSPKDWKVGSIEPTRGIHGDIEYLYVVDLKAKTITCYNRWDKDGNGTDELFVDTAENPWVIKPEDDDE
jgi:hypothetical protein